MNRRVAAYTIRVTGVLLLIVAAIHLVVTSEMKRAILDRVLTQPALEIVTPPFVLNHVVVGILLLLVGFITVYSASAIRNGERWAWVVNFATGLTILSLPVVLALVMRAEYFRAIPFLVASALITIVGVTMTVVLLVVRRDFRR